MRHTGLFDFLNLKSPPGMEIKHYNSTRLDIFIVFSGMRPPMGGPMGRMPMMGGPMMGGGPRPLMGGPPRPPN